MRRVSLHLAVMLCCSLACLGQNGPTDTLFTIDGTAYSSEPFVTLYQKGKIVGAGKQVLSVKDALGLYIDFQLKVKQAKSLGIDTLPDVKRETRTYKDIALYSFMYPVSISEDKIEEAFNRIQYFLRARHILVGIKGQGMPQDTAEAYKKAMIAYKGLLRGKHFSKMVKNYSEDLSHRYNSGELGYFTAFDMDYEFETAAYSLGIGDFSKPVRTRFGYHIIQVLEKIPNPGKVKIRHLFLEYGKSAKHSDKQELRNKADSLYRLLCGGANFASLARQYSDDKKSLAAGGSLPWFGLFEIHPKIEEEAFRLKEINEFSKPFETEFGIHIIQLQAKQDYSSIEGCRQILKYYLSRDPRSRPSVKEVIAKVKKEYGFSENRKLLANFYSILDYAYADLWTPLFRIGRKEYTQEDFAGYLGQQPSKNIYENFIEYINRQYENFLNKSILAFYKKQLMETNLGFKTQMKGYEDEVLVFYITKLKVWDEANLDNDSIYGYFLENKDTYGKNVDFKDVRDQVRSDYRQSVESSWLKHLRLKYKVEVMEQTLSKIKNIGKIKK